MLSWLCCDGRRPSESLGRASATGHRVLVSRSRRPSRSPQSRHSLSPSHPRPHPCLQSPETGVIQRELASWPDTGSLSRRLGAGLGKFSRFRCKRRFVSRDKSGGRRASRVVTTRRELDQIVETPYSLRGKWNGLQKQVATDFLVLFSPLDSSRQSRF